MDSLYNILKTMYSDKTALQLEHELNRIEFLDDYNIAAKSYTRAEIKKAFRKLIKEKSNQNK